MGEGEVARGGEGRGRDEHEETYPIPPWSPCTAKVRFPMGVVGSGRDAGAGLQAQFRSAAPHTLSTRRPIYTDSYFRIELYR